MNLRNVLRKGIMELGHRLEQKKRKAKIAVEFLAWESKKGTQKNETKTLTVLWLKLFPTPCWISRKQNTTLS